MSDTSAPASVVVTLGSTPYMLTANFDAMRVVNRIDGSLTPLFRAVANLDGDRMTLVIAAGAGIRGKPIEALTRAVSESGIEDLIEPLTRFLSLCARGGRAPATAPVSGLTGEQVAAMGDAVDASTRAAVAEVVAGFDGGPKVGAEPSADARAAERARPVADPAPADADPALH